MELGTRRHVAGATELAGSPAGDGYPAGAMRAGVEVDGDSCRLRGHPWWGPCRSRGCPRHDATAGPMVSRPEPTRPDAGIWLRPSAGPPLIQRSLPPINWH